MVGCRGMWQVVEACSRGGGRVWGHVTGVGVSGRVRPTAWMETHGRDGSSGVVWGHVAGCGNMW